MSTIVFVGAFCIVAVLVYMARYSGRLRVQQTRSIAAPVAEVYGKVADFANWREWNPWLEHEPDVQTKLSDTPGVNATCAWSSARIGSAVIENVRLLAPTRIEQRLRFRQPFRFRGRGDWRFVDRLGKTEVTWRMRGRVAFPMRAFAQTVQGMVALDFQYGLERLARAVEPACAGSHYSLAYLGLRDIASTRYAFLTYSGALAGLVAARRSGLVGLRHRLAEQGLPSSGSAIAVYARTDVKLRTTVCHMGIAIGDGNYDDLPVRDLPAHRAYVVRLTGSHAGLEVAWYQAMQRMRIENIEPDPRVAPFERYLADPGTGGEGDGAVDLHVPVRQRTETVARLNSLRGAEPA